MTKKNKNTMPGSKRKGTKSLPNGISILETPAGWSTVFRKSQPRVQSTPFGFRVRHTEQVGAITSDSGTDSRSYAPFGGQFSSQPWLNNLAKNYAKFRVHRLRYWFAPSCPTSQRGSITMSWFADVKDAEYWYSSGSVGALHNNVQTVMGPIWGTTRTGMLEFTLAANEIDRFATNPYKRIGSSVSSDGFNQIFVGAFAYFTTANGSGETLACGNIFVEYDIEFVESTGVSAASFTKVATADWPFPIRTTPSVPLPIPPPGKPPGKPDSEFPEEIDSA